MRLMKSHEEEPGAISSFRAASAILLDGCHGSLLSVLEGKSKSSDYRHLQHYFYSKHTLTTTDREKN